ICTVDFDGASQAAITATPAAGFFFAGWTTDCRGGTAITVHVNGPEHCSAPFLPIVPVGPQTVIVPDSRPGGPHGSGAAQVYTPSNALLTIAKSDPLHNSVTINLSTIDSARQVGWRLAFSARSGEALQTGTYTGAVRAGQFALAPGVDLSSSNSCFSGLTG